MKTLTCALTVIAIVWLNGCSQTVYYEHISMVDNPTNKCNIEYDEGKRHVHIYGKKDTANFARVDVVDESHPSLFPTKISVLCRWGVIPEAEDIPVPPQEVTEVFVTAWETAAPAGTDPPPSRIHKIFFHGSSQDDTFVNNTSIKSVAHGKEGNDNLIGGQSEDHLYGDENDDLLQGRGGNDELYGDVGSDELHGGDGLDQLLGGIGSDDLFGGPGGDFLSVEKQPVNMMNFNKLCGGEGGDYLVGAGNAEDLLDSEIPNGNDGALDTLFGRTEGNTRYEFTPIHDQIIVDDPPPLEPFGANVPSPIDIDCP